MKNQRNSALLLLTFGYSIFAAGVSAQLPTVIPRQVLFGNAEKLSPSLSPSGKMLAYLAPDKNGVMNVWVRTIGQSDDHVVTSEKRDFFNYEWQQDNQHILYLQDNNGDENSHIYQRDLKGTNTRDLTPFAGVQARAVGQRFTDPDFPDEILVALNIRDRRLHDVYRLNLTSGALLLDTQNPGDVASWTADNHFHVRVAQVFLPDGGNEIRIRENPTAPWQSFQKWSPDETFGGVAGFTPDDRSVWLISSVDANAARLLEVDIKTGSSKVVADDKQFDVAGILVHPRNRNLEAVAFLRARSEWAVIDKSVQADFDALKKVRDGDLAVESRDLQDKAWLVSYTVADGPIYYYLYDRDSKKAVLLFTHRPKLEQYRLSKMEPISFKARDGMTIYGYLTLPAGVESKNLPLVLDVHGGPWGRDVWGWNREVQWLANRGYAVLQINFRGSTGYGKDYLNAGNREWAGKMHTDLLDGKNWAVQQGYADPKRVCIFGGSYGGYATLVGVSFTPGEFVCGVDEFGPSNLITLIQSIPPYWVPIRSLFDRRLGNVDKEPEFLKSKSPLFKADQIRVPLFIAQGANDARVKQAESDQIVAAVRKNGKEVEYIVFPDEGHGFARAVNNLKFYAAVEPFLAKYLGGRSEPASDAEKSDDLHH